MGGTGLEQPSLLSEKPAFSENSQQGGTESGTVGGDFDTDLKKLIDSWPCLSGKVKAEILRMIED